MLNTQEFERVSNLCQNPETKGFDRQTGQTWIYPTNPSFRDYQFHIAQNALYENTLVSLPTGLGKTFIAAVVMYNFYRWYPNGKIIFMAPTKPLVEQQVDACYNIMAIPKAATAELTGTTTQASRLKIWDNKRVFFITPQILQNDLDIVPELGAKIKCLVIDEAHKAKGNHAYCMVINKLLVTNNLFRVLALSATPGNSVKDFQDVINNLLIAHVEFRTEDSPDVKPYMFQKVFETVVVPLGDKLSEVKEAYLEVIGKYARALYEQNIVTGSVSNLTKGRIYQLKQEYERKRGGGTIPNYQKIMQTLNVCFTLFYGLEVLTQDGLRSFLHYYKAHIEHPLLKYDLTIPRILDDISNYLGPEPKVEQLPDGSYIDIPPNVKFGHPKFYKLRDILESYFTSEQHESRAIVFFEHREAVHEANALLVQCRPRIRAKLFLGQGAGNTQKLQMQALKQFREGTCNTLLSTCIGEEGLDVGDVNLIICFDISDKSCTRMIQRIGRTGRKRDGKVIVMVTEGKEQLTLQRCLAHKDNLSSFNSKQFNLYTQNPKMIPDDVKPSCCKLDINVKKLEKTLPKPEDLEDIEIIESTERLTTIDFTIHLEKQRIFQSCFVGPSVKTNCLVSLLQYSDCLRYNLGVSNQNLIQTDIRDMFARSQSIKSSSENNNADLFAEITNYISIEKSTECTPCVNWFECPAEPVDLRNWIQPDLAIFDSITDDTLRLFKKSIIDVEEFEGDDDVSNMDQSFLGQNDKSFAYETPKTFSKVMRVLEKSNVETEEVASDKIVKTSVNKVETKQDVKSSEDSLEELLKFFKMERRNIFGSPEDPDKTISYTPPTQRSRTPDLFDSSEKKKEIDEGSPILCSFSRLQSLKRSKKKLFDESQGPSKKPNLSVLRTESDTKSEKNICESNDRTKSDNDLSALLEFANILSENIDDAYEKTGLKSSATSKATPKTLRKSLESELDLDDFYDFSSILNDKSVDLKDSFKEKASSTPVVNAKEQPSIKEPKPSLSDALDFLDSIPTRMEKKKRSALSVINEDTEDPSENEERRKRARFKSNILDDFDKEFDDYFNLTSNTQNVHKASDRNHNKKDISSRISDILENSLLDCDIGSSTKKDVKNTLANTSRQAILKTPKASTSSTLKSATTASISPKKKRSLIPKPITPVRTDRKATPTTTPKRKPMKLNKSKGDSDSDFEADSFAFPKPKTLEKVKPKAVTTKQKTKPKSKRIISEFIDDEAVLDDSTLISDDEDSGEDAYEESFVNDKNHSVYLPNTQMQAHYMKSVKSPVKGAKFKIPKLKQSDLADIYSQVVSQEDNSYLHDSFCVDSDHEELQHDLSELELLEKKLKQMRKEKKKQSDMVYKKRRIIVHDSDSSD